MCGLKSSHCPPPTRGRCSHPPGGGRTNQRWQGDTPQTKRLQAFCMPHPTRSRGTLSVACAQRFPLRDGDETLQQRRRALAVCTHTPARGSGGQRTAAGWRGVSCLESKGRGGTSARERDPALNASPSNDHVIRVALTQGHSHQRAIRQQRAEAAPHAHTSPPRGGRDSGHSPHGLSSVLTGRFPCAGGGGEQEGLTNQNVWLRSFVQKTQKEVLVGWSDYV